MTSADGASPRRGPIGWLFRLVRGITGPWTRANAMAWLKLVVVILIVRWGFVELYSIPSDSMDPVLNGDERRFRGDYVAVNKLIFGPRVPFTTMRLVRLGEPKRWDIVVFNNVNPDAEHKVLIKRVVGLPGERVHIENGAVEINGEPVEPPDDIAGHLDYTQHIVPPDSMVHTAILELAKRRDVPLVLEGGNDEVRRVTDDIVRVHKRVASLDISTLPDARKAELVEDVSGVTLRKIRGWLVMRLQEETPFRYGIRESDKYSFVPENHYFLLGDNSGSSVDGRFFGWVPHENLYGRAFAVALPFSHMKDLTGFTNTWHGLGLLYGIPLVLLYLLEIRPGFVAFSWRVRTDVAPAGLHCGDRVTVDRLTFGFRRPFSGRRVMWRRYPEPGEVVAVVETGENGAPDLRVGRVAAIHRPDGDTAGRLELDTGADAPAPFPLEAVVGSVRRVWWPLGRRRKLQRDAGR